MTRMCVWDAPEGGLGNYVQCEGVLGNFALFAGGIIK